jgi:hypothetical protein
MIESFAMIPMRMFLSILTSIFCSILLSSVATAQNRTGLVVEANHPVDFDMCFSYKEIQQSIDLFMLLNEIEKDPKSTVKFHDATRTACVDHSSVHSEDRLLRLLHFGGHNRGHLYVVNQVSNPSSLVLLSPNLYVEIQNQLKDLRTSSSEKSLFDNYKPKQLGRNKFRFTAGASYGQTTEYLVERVVFDSGLPLKNVLGVLLAKYARFNWSKTTFYGDDELEVNESALRNSQWQGRHTDPSRVNESNTITGTSSSPSTLFFFNLQF